MIKYILHGGETGVPNRNNGEFYREWAKDFPAERIPTILLVYFSRSTGEWKRLEKEDGERFAKYTGNRKVNFILADSDIGTFQEQAKKADVVYIRGGSSDKLFQKLSPIKDVLLKILENKVYAGSSAGVMVLSHLTRSTNSDWKSGLGLLPINSFVHWDEALRGELEFFQKSNPQDNNEWLLLPETEFVVKSY